MPFHRILTLVSYYLAYYFESRTNDKKSSNKKQMPYISSRLTEIISFGRKIPPYQDQEGGVPVRENRSRILLEGICMPDYPQLNEPMDSLHYQIEAKNVDFLSFCQFQDDDPQSLSCATAKLTVHMMEFGYRCPKYGLKPDLLSALNKYREDRLNSKEDTDCLICLVSTPCKKNCLYDGNQKVFKESIWQAFSGKYCDFLASRPKIFIFLTYESSGTKRFFSCVASDGQCVYRIPEHADCIEIHINVTDGEQALRCVRAFCSMLKEHRHNKDLLDILIMLNKELVLDNADKDNSVLVTSTLTRGIFLP
ncbi:uncharacterized protein LOC118190910 [Stegodyphus dumicola]|uniref:uncharacterized protein LOC118190910 n=1 Tax=Stegodyphus dumicola TaxID=202533 RepID=UPI0015AB61E9|nr:uncharacterized protein LOC118190910 [Stegodyphus dumicola]